MRTMVLPARTAPACNGSHTTSDCGESEVSLVCVGCEGVQVMCKMVTRMRRMSMECEEERGVPRVFCTVCRCSCKLYQCMRGGRNRAR